MTPIKSFDGITSNSFTQEGSVLVDGKRRSARSNYSYTADGIPAADEHVLERAKRRTARWNLDSPAGTSSPGNISSTLKFPVDNCVANLKSIGISMGSSSKEINVSLNALKRIEVDKVTVQPKNKRMDTILNPFDLSDEEEPENENRLLSHLIKDITDVDLDDLDLGMRICDLKVTGRKSKSTSKKAKAQKKTQKLNKSVTP